MIIGGMLITFRPKLFKMKGIYKTMYPMVIAIIVMAVSTYLNTENKFAILGLYSIGGFGIMLSLALSNIISLTYIQQEIREEMLGKVSAFSTAVATASVAPGQLIYGQLIDINLSLFNILILSFIFSIAVVSFIRWNVREI
jgi:ABC-type transport system involved in multi-copper enzyme maturation permease subunit